MVDAAFAPCSGPVSTLIWGGIRLLPEKWGSQEKKWGKSPNLMGKGVPTHQGRISVPEKIGPKLPLGITNRELCDALLREIRSTRL